MPSSPAISVIIPAKDAQLHIADTLTSLLHQDVPVEDLEVVVVDDGSSDSTGEIVASRHRDFPHLRLLRNDRPGGVSAARNQAMAACTGRYITFIDSDDWFANGHLRVMVEAIEDLDVDFVRSDVIHAIGKSRKLMVAPVAVRHRALSTKDFIVDGWSSTMVDFPNPFSGLYRRQLWESGVLRFDEALRSAEDREWNWRICLLADTFAVVDSPGPVYRRNVATSLTAVYDESQLSFIDSCLRTIEITLSRPEFRRYTVKAGHNLLALADVHLLRRDEMTRDLHAALIERVATAAARLPDAEWTAIIGSFKPERTRRLGPILRKVRALRSHARSAPAAQCRNVVAAVQGGQS